ncbi:MAG: flagellar filament capping protein FliD [Planctomycetes bacterium]|nr:flagellar filament capping protein FliD [Planctomycetota bacterium]
MSTLRTGIGLISGLKTAELVDALIAAQRAAVRRLESRVAGFEATDAGLSTLDANLVSLKAAAQGLGETSRFSTFSVTNSDSSRLLVTAGSAAVPGTYRFQPVRQAATHEVTSRGFASADQQAIGTGTVTIADGGRLEAPTPLDFLNGGEGVRRGTIRITDRAGNTADVDLANAYTIDDVREAIDAADGLSVTATTSGGRLVLTDTSGSTSTNLSVVDLAGGFAAADLGIAASVASSTLTGSEVYYLTSDFTLDRLGDGNTLHRLAGAPDLRITPADGVAFDVTLDEAQTLGDVIDAINDHAGNAGRVTAALVAGRIELTDSTTGGTLAVTDINGSAVVRALGLDTAVSGSQLTGRRLIAGFSSVLLHNLRGGAGIDQTGQISLTDRSGRTATIDLTGAESLDEVLVAINGAVDGGGVPLGLTARVNEIGHGIEIEDTTGSTASNLIIADVGGSTLAAQLGIAVNAAADSVASGPLSLRYVNEATALSDYAPDGGAPAAGSIRITDSAGASVTVEISSAAKTVGDVLQRINSAATTAGVAVSAQLNDTGDGFVLVDNAAGAGALKVEESGSTTAAELRLLGNVFTGGDGKQRITSRRAAVVSIAAGDTLDDLVEKVNAAAAFVKAATFDDGSAINPSRLRLSAAASGASGRLVIDPGALDLGLSVATEGRDALLRVGDDPQTGFLLAAASNSFPAVTGGLDVDVLSGGGTIVTATITRDDSKVVDAIEAFIAAYNTFVGAAADLTLYDSETGKRGVLQGQGIVLRIEGRLDRLVTGRTGNASDPLRSLVDLGVRVTEGGKLTLDEDVLAQRMADDPQAVADYFLTETTGFADRAFDTLEGLTDPLTGTIALEQSALEDSIDSLNARIEELDEILEIRRARLLQEFVNMENALAALSSQQEALAAIPNFGSRLLGN